MRVREHPLPDVTKREEPPRDQNSLLPEEVMP
jgi:hypothetical protein